MYEFDTFYNFNTGDTSLVFTGSGVRLTKELDLSISLRDPDGGLISSDYDLVQNQYVEAISFDILDINGNNRQIAYQSGKNSNNIKFTELENEAIFGSYTKDFGVRLSVKSYNNTYTVSEFYSYANIPQLNTGLSTVYDGKVTYTITTSPDPYEPSSTITEIVNIQQYDQIVVNLILDNSLKYIDIIKYDVYASDSDNIVLFENPNLDSSDNPYFLYSQKVENYQDVSTLTIKPNGLLYDKEYWFAVVPYSIFGSGNAFHFGPMMFTGLSDQNPPSLLETDRFRIYQGDEFVELTLLTGKISSPPPTNIIIDNIESGYADTAIYLAQFETGVAESKKYITSELKVTLNNPITLLESPITNTGQLKYSVDQVNGNHYLYVSGAPINSSYKIYKTVL